MHFCQSLNVVYNIIEKKNQNLIPIKEQYD